MAFRVDAWLWSIPACAGEPTDTGLVLVLQKVYPCVCGGTR